MQDEKQKASVHCGLTDSVCLCEQVVRKCNEGARTMERTEMMYTINSQLEFKIKVWTWHKNVELNLIVFLLKTT